MWDAVEHVERGESVPRPGSGGPGRAASRRIGASPGLGSTRTPWWGREGSSTVGVMAEHQTDDRAREIEQLLREIQRYLAAVDEFRRQGHEPHWRREEIQA